ncbi:MAG: ATP-binding protein [Methylacidiphilales bacterium]|nr:ATP-binding protein [Candidatus Methylacidiphilales bacterium]
MIYRVSIENFFSVADHQELKLEVPENTPNLPCFRNAPGRPDSRLPLIVGLYGPNASGKSTVLRAITTTAWFVQHSFTIPANNQIPLFNPYASTKWWDRPSKILVEFDSQLQNDGEAGLFRYELHIGHEAARFGKSVEYESLSYAPKDRFRRIFERKGQEFQFGSEYGITPGDPRVRSVRSNSSVISTLAQHNHKFSADLIHWLVGLQSNIQGLEKAQGTIAYALSYYAQRPEYLKGLNQELSRLDLGLLEMKVQPAQPGPIAMFKHEGLDCDIVLGQESMGTRRFIEIFPLLQFVLDCGGVAVIDELDTDIHPLIVPEIFRWFYDQKRNPKSAQLFFTAHNPAILDEMEKEQVYFTEKRSGKPTGVYGARHIKGLRRQPSLMKKYLSGELGAVPHIG